MSSRGEARGLHSAYQFREILELCSDLEGPQSFGSVSWGVSSFQCVVTFFSQLTFWLLWSRCLPFQDSADAQVAWDAILCGQDVSVQQPRIHRQEIGWGGRNVAQVQGSKGKWAEAVVLLGTEQGWFLHLSYHSRCVIPDVLFPL